MVIQIRENHYQLRMYSTSSFINRLFPWMSFAEFYKMVHRLLSVHYASFDKGVHSDKIINTHLKIFKNANIRAYLTESFIL